MLGKLLWIEWSRAWRRPLLWIALVGSAIYCGLSLANFYKTSATELLDGTLKTPGVSFDLANSLDQLLVAIPFLVMLAAVLVGNDYTQRTNQHWLMRAPRASSLLAKFLLVVGVALLIQVTALLVGGFVGLYYKQVVYHLPNTLNVNWMAALAAPAYMTLASLPYIAFSIACTVATRSPFAGMAISLGYSQFLEFVFSGIFHGASWTKWLMTNVQFSISFVLNSIGNRAAEIPGHILMPVQAMTTAAGYTLVLLFLAVWLYRRQDVGG